MKCSWCVRLSLALLFGMGSVALGDATFPLKGVGGATMTPDNKTLVVSVPHQAALIFYDTLADKETKRLEVDFQPTHLAAQNGKLFAAVKGSAAVRVLDAATGKELQSVKLPGEPLIALGCHPSKGLLYAVNSNNEVFAIDPDKGTSAKTGAKGQLLVVDPVDGKWVYTGIQKPIQEKLVFEEGPGGKVLISLAQANLRAVMLKYAVSDRDLKLVAANENAAINGKDMAVSGDGKRIAMAGGGGWRGVNDPKTSYSVAAFETSDMVSQLGLVETGPYPSGVAFHPVLNYGAAFNRTEVTLFSSKSFVKRDALKPAGRASYATMMFGGQGTKLIFLPSLNARAETDCTLEFKSLTLTDEDREALKKAYPK
jgi:hypothetical protein